MSTTSAPYIPHSDAETLAALEKVKTAIDDAGAKAKAMNYNSYDNSVVQERYDSRKIFADGSEEVHMTYLALANAARKVSSIPADMRYTILNNSFEMGRPFRMEYVRSDKRTRHRRQSG